MGIVMDRISKFPTTFQSMELLGLVTPIILKYLEEALSFFRVFLQRPRKQILLSEPQLLLQWQGHTWCGTVTAAATATAASTQLLQRTAEYLLAIACMLSLSMGWDRTGPE